MQDLDIKQEEIRSFTAQPSVVRTRWSFGLLLLSCAAIIGLNLLSFWIGPEPFHRVWEDAYMIVRYADHLRSGWGLAWNPGGEPTYGITALSYVLPVALIRSLFPDDVTMTLALSSGLFGCIFVALVTRLILRYLNAVTEIKLTILFLVGLSLIFAGDQLTAHFWSGMDTTYDLAFITAYFLTCKWHERVASWRSAIVLGALGGITFLVRPDLLIFTVIVPVAMFAFARSSNGRRQAALVAGITLAMTVLTFAFTVRYFHSALPLPFYAKGRSLYDDFDFSPYKHVAISQLARFILSYRLLIAIIIIDLAIRVRRREWSDLLPFDAALMLGTAVFCCYYFFFVLQIMYMNQRFYYPMLPAIIWLSARATARLLNLFRNSISRVPSVLWTVLAGSIWFVALTQPLAHGALDGARLLTHHLAPTDIDAEYRSFWSNYWFRLDAFSKLPNDLVISTTEMGHVAAMNPGKVVVDMAGLNERDFAHHRFTAQHFFARYQPDLIFMPHPGYRGMVRSLLENTYFKDKYDYYPADKLRPDLVMGLAIRRDSKYYAEMRSVIGK